MNAAIVSHDLENILSNVQKILRSKGENFLLSQDYFSENFNSLSARTVIFFRSRKVSSYFENLAIILRLFAQN